MPTYIIYKPFGMLSQFTKELEHHVTLADLDFNFAKDVYPVGRLDADSEGLLLLTNDKSLNQKILNPKFKQPKTYWAQVEGQPSLEELSPLQSGVKIKVKGKFFSTSPAKVRLLNNVDLPDRNPPIRFRKNSPTAWVEIVLIEGKNRQVRKMFASIGFPVLRLVRVGLVGFNLFENELKGLKGGEVREV